VGLARGTGALLTNRAGCSANARSSGDLPGRVNSIHPAEMHLIRRHQADPGVVVILVVPIEEPAAEVPGVINAPEPLRNLGWYFRVLKWLSENGLSLDV
jgi:hypothetical protein